MSRRKNRFTFEDHQHLAKHVVLVLEEIHALTRSMPEGSCLHNPGRTKNTQHR